MSLRDKIISITDAVLNENLTGFINQRMNQTINVQATAGVINTLGIDDSGTPDGTAQVTLVDGTILTCTLGAVPRIAGEPVWVVGNIIY